MTVSTASVVRCPKCGTQTATYCYGTKKPDVKIRYRRCPKCENRIKTIQRFDDPEAGEKIVPTMTQEEQNKHLAKLRATQQGRRKSMKGMKLTERDAAEIKYLVLNNVQTQAYTAMQYGVEKTAIHRIATGVCFADIPTPKSLADL